jgi:hypothetical protein
MGDWLEPATPRPAIPIPTTTGEPIGLDTVKLQKKLLFLAGCTGDESLMTRR